MNSPHFASVNRALLQFGVAIAAAILGTASTWAQDVVVNGGFVAATNNTDWIISGTAKLINYNGDRSSDGDGWCGEMLLGNASVTNGTIYQVINVTPGTTYTFIYDYAKNGTNPKIYVDVFAGAVTASNYVSHPVGSGGLFSITNTATTTIPAYLSQAAVLTPATSQITIRFSDAKNTTSKGTDGFVDHVRLIKGLVTWNGTASANTWNTTPGNTVWLSDTSSVAAPFANANYVAFDGFAATNVVEIPGAVSPSTIVVNNTAADPTNAVTFEGAGAIAGITTALEKRGAGMLTINTTNTFGGPVIISGTVSINSLKNADGSASSLGAPIDSANGTIKLGLGATPGTLLYTGTGDTSDRIIDLTGASAVTSGGATLNNQGTGLLKFTSDFQASVSGSSSTTKTLTLDNFPSGPGEIAGAIVDGYLDVGAASATGVKMTALNMIGTGTWTLSGTNTYTGGTTISSGTLRLGDGVSRNGVVAGNITDNATLEFATPADQTYSGVISGTGALVKSGAGTLALAADQTYSGGSTINAGALQIGNGINDSSVLGVITNDAFLIFDTVSNQICSNEITGTGALTKAGNGTLQLAGDCTYTGGTEVQAGTLVLSSTCGATGELTVHDGAALSLKVVGQSQFRLAALTLGDSTGANITFSDLSDAVAAIKTGTLTCNGTTLINITTGAYLPRAYPLMEYTALTGGGGFALGTLPPNMTAHLATNANQIQLVVDHVLTWVWNGAANGHWDASATNWTTNGLATTYSDGSTVQFDDSASRFLVTNSIVVSPAAIFVTNNIHDYTFSGAAIAGTGGLLKNGAGTLTFLGTNTYSGTTTVGGGTLAGNGVLGGPVLIQLDGTLRAGTAESMGAFTLGNSLAMGGSVVMRISRTGGVATSDLIKGMTSVNYGGTLTVTNITSDGTPLVAGDRFRLFAGASYSGSFAATNLPPLPAGLAWVWLPNSGVLAVIDPSNPPDGNYAFYVSPDGNDASGDGSLDNPWRTIEQARDYIRNTALNLGMTGDITVYLRGGHYQLDQTITFTSADSADNGHFITYKSYPGEQALLSGGKRVTGWTQVPGKPYWVASVSTNAGFADYFRQLYVNGIREERAHSDWITNVGVFDDPATTQSVDGVTFNPSDFNRNYSHVADLRMFRIGDFKVDEFPVTSIVTNGSTGLIQVELQQPYCQTRYNYSRWASDVNSIGTPSQWMVIQAMEELDEPGEWCLDRATQQVYYYPYSFEDMNTAEVYVPVVETLLSLTGDSTTDKVRNLRFENLLFEHGNWFFPRDYFIGGTQAEILMPAEAPDAISPASGAPYGFEVPGQIKLNNTEGIQFIGNTFQHLASCGIHLFNGARDTLIKGNYFYDLTAAAVLGGRWGGDDPIPNQETCTNTVVADNVIRKIGSDFMAATAIDNLWHYGFQVMHNDIADSQYMGFHQRTSALTIADGAGTGGTVASFNRITLANTGSRYGVGDGGFIYSFGVWPDTTIQGNDISFINSPTKYIRGMMWDNASYGLTGISNVIWNVKSGSTGYFLYRSLTGYQNLLTDSFGDATVNNFSAVNNINFTTFPLGSPSPAAQDIINHAGLEPAYTNLLQFVYSGINLAQGKPAWASSHSGSGNAPAAAEDWDYSTSWQPLASDTNQCWWAVDLGMPFVIRRIELGANMSANQPDARCNFRVEGDNDSSFSNPAVLSEQNSVPFAYKRTGLPNSWVRYSANPRAFRYVRVIKTAPGTLNFSEVRLFGYALATEPPPLVAQVSGSNIYFSWPPGHLGWRLQMQTNGLESGLGTNWVTLPGSASVTATNIPINPNLPSVFFRLVNP